MGVDIKSLKLFNYRMGYFVSAIALLFAAMLPAMAAAAQVTDRSLSLSSSSAAATGVTYTINFTAVGGAGAFVLDFCSDSPVMGEVCTAPSGMNAAGAASTTSGFTDVTGSASKVIVVGAIGADDQVSVAISGITNPSAAGPLYARIATFANEAAATAYTSETPGSTVDEGGIATSITNSVGVSGAVLESLTFCVSGQAISANCTGTNSPVLKLGETVGDIVALTPTAVSTGTINTQISTNAASGAVVRLKSNALNCGGLLRAGAPSACDIAPALTSGISEGQAKFGVRTATATDTPAVGAMGTYQPVTGSGYNDTTYALNYVSGNATGVTSIFGDPFLDTNNAPANNKNMALTFGASVNNGTPAGTYSADLSLIATGKF